MPTKQSNQLAPLRPKTLESTPKLKLDREKKRIQNNIQIWNGVHILRFILEYTGNLVLVLQVTRARHKHMSSPITASVSDVMDDARQACGLTHVLMKGHLQSLQPLRWSAGRVPSARTETALSGQTPRPTGPYKTGGPSVWPSVSFGPPHTGWPN